MAEISKTDPGANLFPEFENLYDLISSEVVGLDDAQLDFTSKDWSWSEWSIRMQLSHMASLIPRWLVARWGHETFPNGDHGLGNLTPIIKIINYLHPMISTLKRNIFFIVIVGPLTKNKNKIIQLSKKYKNVKPVIGENNII